MSNQIEEYVSLIEQKRQLEKRLNELKPSIISTMEEQESTQISKGNVTLQLHARKVWVYSVEIEKAEIALKAQKRIEQCDGSAAYSETKYLTVRGV